MNILSCNQNYFIRGGSDKYFFDINVLLKDAGNRVIPFAARSDKNLSVAYEKFFPHAANFEEPGVKDVLSYIYNLDAKKKLKELLLAENIDIAHLHIYYGKLTSSILKPLKKNHIPVVQTLHEYKTVCPVYTMYRGGLCHECSGGKFYNCFLNKCNRGSALRSFASTLESYTSQFFGASSQVDAFICVSDFQKSQLIQMGMAPDKLHTIHNFVETDYFQPTFSNKGYFLYYGRIEEVKGLRVLVDAFKEIPRGFDAKLLIVGDGGYKKELRQYCLDHEFLNIEFLPHMELSQLKPIIEGAIATVMPSLWYETFGLTVLESFSAGKPVIASNIGGMTETVLDNETGFLVTPGDPLALAEKIEYLISNPEKVIEFGRNAKARVDTYFSKKIHLEKILNLYQKVIDGSSIR